MAHPLSILDLVPVGAGVGAAESLRASRALARRAAELGYLRYWFAEHHALPAVASSAPEVLVPAVAAETSRIRVGAGGMMVPNHAPLHVVELFRTLEALYPGRIDLGLGRAPGTDPITARALRRQLAADDDVDARLAELLAFEEGTIPPAHPFAAVRPVPGDVRLPSIWMLGSTDAGARIAAALGVGYAFAGHFQLAGAELAIGLYKARFRPSARAAAPYAILAVSVITADDPARVAELEAVAALSFLRRGRGDHTTLPSVEEARAHPWTVEEREAVDPFLDGVVRGSPEAVRAQLERLVAGTGADELMISIALPYPEERRRAYERLAEVFGLAAEDHLASFV